ncbi:MAG: EamA family transporter [Gaiellaceae bacterium]
MLAVAFALLSAVLFGGMTVGLRFGLQGGRGDPELGALVTTVAAAAVAGAAALVVHEGEPLTLRAAGLFALAGLIAPGASQLLFTRAVRDAGPSRTSVVVGTAPLFAAAIAIALLGEPIELPLVVGGFLVVLAGIILVSEPDRPEHIRLTGIAIALVATLLFTSRDNLVRWYAEDASSGSVSGAAVAIAAGAAAILLVVAVTRRRSLVGSARGLPWRPFALAGVFFGLSYVFLFAAYYRARVTVVSPLVATESLWGVSLSALLFKRTELIGLRLVTAASLVVAGGTLITLFR